MRIYRRKILNVAGTVFLAAAVLMLVFLITGLRSYAELPEIPLRVCEILAMLLMAVYTYFFSRKFSFMMMTASCAVMLVPLIGTLTGLMQGVTYRILVMEGQPKPFFDILAAAGYILIIALSILSSPVIRRSGGGAALIRLLAVTVIVIFAAEIVYSIVCLVSTLNAETYPHQYRTKDWFAALVTYLAVIITGAAYFVTAGVDPSASPRGRGDNAGNEKEPDAI